MSDRLDRSAQDVGNIVSLEHVNVTVPDPLQAHLFYVSAMGFTRDPYIDFGVRNMWINLGQQQFHLPLGPPQIVRGRIGIVTPSLSELVARLERVSGQLSDSLFDWDRADGHLVVTCPWGNRLEVFEAGRFGGMRLGMPYVSFDVPVGSAPGIASFYRELIGAPSSILENGGTRVVRVAAGAEQWLEFRERVAEPAGYDGHHIAIYVADFSGPYGRLLARDLITEESGPCQYRFQAVVDPGSERVLLEVEHEVRSLRHPMYARALVNRNPAQSTASYQRGADAFLG